MSYMDSRLDLSALLLCTYSMIVRVKYVKDCVVSLAQLSL